MNFLANPILWSKREHIMAQLDPRIVYEKWKLLSGVLYLGPNDL